MESEWHDCVARCCRAAQPQSGKGEIGPKLENGHGAIRRPGVVAEGSPVAGILDFVRQRLIRNVITDHSMLNERLLERCADAACWPVAA